MHRSHLIPCGVMLVAVVVLALMGGVQLGTVAAAGVMLLCPLVMLLVMRATSGGTCDAGDHAPREITR